MTTNKNINTNKNNIEINIDLEHKPKRRRPRKKPQPPPPEPAMPPVAAQPQWTQGITAFSPRPVIYAPSTQQIMPEGNPLGVPQYFQNAYTNLQATMNTMNENLQNELLDVRSILEAQATKQSHFDKIQQIAKATQDEFQKQLDTFNVMPPLEEIEEPVQPTQPDDPTPVEPHRPLEGLWGDEELEEFMKPTPVKDLINKFEGKEQTESDEDNIFSPDKYDYITRLYATYQGTKDHNKARPIRKELKGMLAKAGFDVETAKLKGLMNKYDAKFKEIHQ